MDDQDWIALPGAVALVGEVEGLGDHSARQWILDRVAKEYAELGSRIGLRTGWDFGGQPERNVTMSGSTWRDLVELNGDWWTSGNALFDGSDLAYRNIQIHAGDLGIHLGQSAATANPTSLSDKSGTSETRDFGIAVQDAQRLNDCFGLLHQALIAAAAVQPPEWLIQKWQYLLKSADTKIGAQWNRHFLLKEMAKVEMQVALGAGELPVWVVTDNGDRTVDKVHLMALHHSALPAGLYLAREHPSPHLEGRPLWVKLDDWAPFLAKFIGKEEAISNAPILAPFSDEERRHWMQGCGIANGDKAFRQYKLEPRRDGTKQASWRIEWRQIHGRGRGRPGNS